MFKNNFIINIDVARKNIQAHEKRMEKLRRKYIKELCKDIDRESKRGRKYICTKNSQEKFMTYDYMMEIKVYFEKLGFMVTEKESYHGTFISYLKISWED